MMTNNRTLTVGELLLRTCAGTVVTLIGYGVHEVFTVTDGEMLPERLHVLWALEDREVDDFWIHNNMLEIYMC